MPPQQSGIRYHLVQGCKNFKWYEWILLFLMVTVPFCGGLLGARLFNNGSYKNALFAKPFWSPPSIVFSPVWTLMYILMGAASFIVYKSGHGFNRDTVPALLLYLIQLMLNWLWGPLVFGYNAFGTGLSIGSAVWGTVCGCIFAFIPVSALATALMLPYFVWVTFIVALNYSILCLNTCHGISNMTVST